ncbi:F-box only protein 2 [Desmophyllum pertusum]|uniref:F-box only protein 2 n=1 Tax=Desmophyllum pertusum TaxID=174260 RepID=A0A9W9YR92_9CNID|nr:F-box only protein 2 [Desmophyllum pertusum]
MPGSFPDPQNLEGKSPGNEVVQWNVSDAKNISSYLCEIHSIEANTVVFSKEVAGSVGDSLESSLKIDLNEISDKTKSPYRIHVCSLGVSATLASVFVTSNGNLSFLPQVDGISRSYDPQSNQLTVSWLPVNGAPKYNVSIREKTSISSVVSILTSDGEKTKVVFEMGNVPLHSGVKYVVTVVAEGSDALHLPTLPSTSDTEFAQLPKPASVSQEYSFEEKKIKVTFQPVSDASAHLIEVFNVITPIKIAGKQVVPKATGVDWPATEVCSFDVYDMTFHGGAQFKTRVIAQGNANWIDSSPGISSTTLTCSDAAISVALYNTPTDDLMIVVSSRPGHFTAKLQDIVDNRAMTQTFCVKRDTVDDSVHQTLLEFPINPDEEPRGAIYQAFVLNTGDQQYLPSEVKESDEVPLLDPPASVSQEYKDGVFTVVWKCVQSATGYYIRVYNTKTGSTASEVSVTSDVRPAGEQMKKEFDVDSLLLESDGLYQTSVMVLGDEVSIGGASTKSNTTITSFPSPEDVKITFNNETRHMLVRCSSVKGAVSIKLGVVDADELKNDETNIQGALLRSQKVTITSGDDSKSVEAEFGGRVLLLHKSHDGLYRGVAQVMEKHGEVSLPSGFSISDDVVAWLKPPVPIQMHNIAPAKSYLMINWTPVNLAVRYLVQILQKREDKNGTTTLIPFSNEAPGNVYCFGVNMANVNVDESDKFVAKVQSIGNPGTVITIHSTGYSSETLVCDNSPTDIDVLQVEDETVKVTWKGDSATTFQFSVWRMSQSGDHEDVFSKETDKFQLISTSRALRMISPGRYRFGVRAQGSTNKLHSVYTHSDVLAVIMDAPTVTIMKMRPEVTVEWTPVDNNPTQNFSNYVIHYRLQRGTESEWNQVQVEISAKEKMIVDLQPDSDYLFCISVASPKRGNGIRSQATAVHTKFGTADLPDPDGNNRWCVSADYFEGKSEYCCRAQMIDLLARGFTPEYLDEMKPDIEVYEWFAIQAGGSGTFIMNVSLLDSNKNDLPGENSRYRSSSTEVPVLNNGSWARLGHTFSNYPSGLRFIQFEEAVQSRGLHDAYNVKAFRPTVKISKTKKISKKSMPDCLDKGFCGETVQISKEKTISKKSMHDCFDKGFCGL